MRSPAHPFRRLVGSQPARTQGYLLLGLVVGLLWFALVGALYLSAITSEFVLFGIALVIGAQLLLRPIGRVERLLVGSLLGQDVAAPEPLRYARSTGSRRSILMNAARRAGAVFRDGHSWRVLLWTMIRFVAGPVGFAVVVVRFVLPPLLVLAPMVVLIDVLSDDLSLDAGWRYGLLLCPAGLVLVVPLDRAMEALATLHRRLAVWALGPGRATVEAAALARAAQAEEQVRIDQELHDSIGHMLSMIVVQAGAGAHVFDSDQDFARRALETIEQRGRAALGELDRIITNFRHDHASHPWPPAGAQRWTGARGDTRGDTRGEISLGGRIGQTLLPEARDLPQLIADARNAGMDVTARIQIGDLPPAVGRGTYRIVQEALTNAAKHAPGLPVTVDIAAREQVVAVSVVNGFRGSWPAPGSRGDGRGYGLASIHDRATLLGGEVTVGVLRRGAFAVRAVLPLAAMLPEGVATRCAFTSRCGCLGCAIRHTVLG